MTRAQKVALALMLNAWLWVGIGYAVLRFLPWLSHHGVAFHLY